MLSAVPIWRRWRWILRVVDGDGIITTMAEKGITVLVHVVLVIISGQPAQPPLLIHTQLHHLIA